jgi:hypothetical protein
MDYDWADVFYLLAALALPVSALIGRKLRWRTGLLMALAWIGIFGVVALFITAIRG